MSGRGFAGSYLVQLGRYFFLSRVSGEAKLTWGRAEEPCLLLALRIQSAVPGAQSTLTPGTREIILKETVA